jgi:hypothetical protein
MKATAKKIVTPKAKTKPKVRKPLSARSRIKPRGLVGAFAGRIHYDEAADIFNLKR